MIGSAALMRPYTEVVEEIRKTWNEGVAMLARAIDLALEQGLVAEVGELQYGLCMVEGKRVLEVGPLDPRERLAALVSRLDLRSSQPAGRDEVWIICPRSHAMAHAEHGIRIPEGQNGEPFRAYPIDYGRELFRMVDRFIDGPDLIYAIAPSH